MQDVEKNMDDLFREAAEKYNPKPTESGWNEIAPQLDNNLIDAAVPVVISKRRRNTAVLLLLLLLPLCAVMLSHYFFTDNNKQQITAANHSSKQKTVQQNGTLTESDARQIVTEKNNKPDGNTNQLQLLTGKPVIEIFEKNNVKYKVRQNALITSASDSLHNILTSQISEQQMQKGDVIKRTDTSITTDISSTTDTSTNQSATAKKTASSSKQKKLYLGVVFGPALNEVKQQGFKKAGFDIGLKTAYRFNKKWFLEAGLLYTKKYYFSDGKYFNMDKMPAGMQVVSLTGSSNLFEVPVAVKYNIVQKNNTGFFAAAGVSSYLLTKENNNYITVLNGTQQNMKGLYKNVSAGLASSVHLGFGYEHAFSKKNYLQIEPYVQIPLKGIGVGNMQVKSAGVRIAVTLPVH